ncbi:MAG TPA: CAP domain-containing protein [Chthoniobacteraceae bacterium]|nr:CAP domain-containing protein [Chthoniobacteraceae bacterium]
MTFRFSVLFLVLATIAARAESVALQVLDEINFARTQPQQYAQILASHAENSRGSEGTRAVAEAIDFLQRARPLPPLAWSAGISQAALSHALDVGPRGGSGHTGSRGDTPWKRMSRYGQWQGYAGENIDYGHGSARAIVISLIVDNGVRSRQHRANLFSHQFRVAGIAVGPHANWGTMCVMDFASGFSEAGEERVATGASAGFHSAYSGMSFF